MLGKIIGAAVGERLASRYGSGARGALIGALVPTIARRLVTPLGVALAGAYVAKRLYDRRRERGAA